MNHESILTKIEKTQKCYKKQNSEPLLGFFIGDEYPNIRYTFASDLPDYRPLRPEDFNIDSFIADCEILYQEHCIEGADLFWTATPFWGIPWIEAMLGMDIFFNKRTSSIIANNSSSKLNLDNIPEFSTSNPWVVLMQRFFDAIRRSCRNRYPIGTTRIRGLADIMSVIYGGENFIFKAVDSAEEIKQYLDKITPFYINLMNFQLKNIPLFYGGIGSFYYYNWVPIGTVWHQEDSVMLLSPQIYNEVFFEYDKKIYNSFPNNICHFHSTGGYIPYRQVLSLKPLCIEMHLDFEGPSAKDLFNIHKEILSKTNLLIWGEFKDSDLEWVYNNLPPQGLILAVHVPNREQADQILHKYKGGFLQ